MASYVGENDGLSGSISLSRWPLSPKARPDGYAITRVAPDQHTWAIKSTLVQTKSKSRLSPLFFASCATSGSVYPIMISAPWGLIPTNGFSFHPPGQSHENAQSSHTSS